MLFLLFLLLSSAHAQTMPRCSDYLHCAAVAAKDNLDRVNRLIEFESRQRRVDFCRIHALRLDREYTEWFRSRLPQFTGLVDHYLQARGFAAQKLEQLKGMSVLMLPERGQSVGNRVALTTLIEYINDFNAKVTSVLPEELEEFMKLRQDSTFNQPHLSHEQIIWALERFSQNLNASLSDSSGTYRLELRKKGQQLDLVLAVLLAGVQAPEAKAFSLLAPLPRVDTPATQQAIWDEIFENEVKIDGYRLDAHERYFQMLALQPDRCFPDPMLRFYRSEDKLPFEYPARIYKVASDNRKLGVSPYLASLMIPVHEDHIGPARYYWTPEMKVRRPRVIEDKSNRELRFKDRPVFYVFREPLPGIEMIPISVYESDPEEGEWLSATHGGMATIGYIFAENPVGGSLLRVFRHGWNSPEGKKRFYGSDRIDYEYYYSRAIVGTPYIFEIGWTEYSRLGYVFSFLPVKRPYYKSSPIRIYP